MLTIHSQTREVTRSGQYWAFAHFSKAIRRGAKHIGTICKSPTLTHVACQNPGGDTVLVLGNPGTARPVNLRVGNNLANLSLEADSVTTLVWS